MGKNGGMTRDEEWRSPAHGQPVFRPWAKRRIRLAGLAAGPLSAAGWGTGSYAVMSLAEAEISPAGHALRLGFAALLIVLAWLVSRRILRPVHARERITTFGMLLAGLPLAPLARGIALIASFSILGLGQGTAAGHALVWLTATGGLAVAGALSGPLAWAFVGAMSPHLPGSLRDDPQAVARHRESTTRRSR